MSSELKFSSPGNTAGGNFATPHEDGEASPSPEVTLWERSLDLWTSAIAPRRGVATATARATAFGVTPKTGTLNTAGTSFVAPHAQALREVDQGLAFLTRIPRSISADASASVGL